MMVTHTTVWLSPPNVARIKWEEARKRFENVALHGEQLRFAIAIIIIFLNIFY